MEILFDNLGTTLTIPSPQKPTPISYNPLYTLSNLLSTSFGPYGLDKLIQTTDNEILLTNDGATILSHINTSNLQFFATDSDIKFKQSINFILNLVIDLSKSQDNEIGDGTTSVVILASALLKLAEDLIKKGIHPIKIIKNLETALIKSIRFLENISETIDYETYAIKAAKSALNSKIVSFKSDDDYKKQIKKSTPFFSSLKIDEISNEKLAEICVKSINKIKMRKDVNFDLIRLIKKPGASISQTKYFDGLLIEKSFAHIDMPKKQEGLIGLLAEPLELPKMKTKHEIGIKNVEDFENLCKFEKDVFLNIIAILKKKNINILLCQWGFEDEVTSLLMENGISAVRWVGGSEMELAAVCLNGNIAARIGDIEGVYGEIEEICYGSESEAMIRIQSKTPPILYNLDASPTISTPSSATTTPPSTETISAHSVEPVDKTILPGMCTILIRGSTKISLEESERSIHDALCAVRNLNQDNKIVYGGGCAEVTVSKMLNSIQIAEPDSRIVYKALAEALLEIPKQLIKNGGFPVDSINLITNTVGVDGNMKELSVFDTLKAKSHMWKSAVEVVTRILKCDEVIFND
ncbi:T-complex protein 1 subunit epsilon [Cucumispora dikerogammari]|nr:T-complex protein 1 subunit epsilon [Cucumispora dikerogammari]